MDNPQYLELFIEESQEHLQNLNTNLLILEEQPEHMEVINEIFRSAHTLKGMAGSMGLKTIAELAHGMESVLDNMRNGKLKVSVDITDVLFECLDFLEMLLQDIIHTGNESKRDISVIKSKLNGFIYGMHDNTTKDNDQQKVIKELPLDGYHVNIINEAYKSGFTPYYVEVKLKDTCLMKAARAYIIFKAIEDYGEVIYSCPPVQDIEEEKFDLSFSLVAICKAELNTIKNELDNISEIESIDIKEIRRHDIQTLYKGDAVYESSPSNTVQNQGSTNKEPTTEIKDKLSKSAGRSIRVDIERLDRLMNLVSELIIIKNRIQDMNQYDNTAAMTESIEYLGRITNDLHDAVMKVRMIPIQTVFDRFPRTVRDLSRNTGKDVKLNIVGSETEVDRTVIDEIGEPLIHLIRNAIDHGIESPHERSMMGKAPVGNVDLKAYHDGNNVVIEISDDGRGIDVEKVLKRAIQQKLITPEEAENLSEQEIFQFIFEPGFSTADKVTDISGRGVGMDVVKTKIESLGGVVDIDSQPNRGTKFIIRLPLTLSIIQALLISIGREIYAIPIGSIKEILDVPIKHIRLVRKKEFIDYRGLLIPFIRLDKILESPVEQVDAGEVITTIIVKKGEKMAALSVGQLIGQQEIVIKSLGKVLSKIKIVSGATILGDGQVALILDVNHLI